MLGIQAETPTNPNRGFRIAMNPSRGFKNVRNPSRSSRIVRHLRACYAFASRDLKKRHEKYNPET